MRNNDIRIGDNEFIRWVPLNQEDYREYDASAYFDDAGPFWQRLEAECVAGCCGIHAFDFTPENIKQAAQTPDAAAVKCTLTGLQQSLGNWPENVVCVNRFNQRFDKGVFLHLLDHIITRL